MPRATTAAWLVMPPRVVRMPSAACMPWMSSGLVSMRTRMTLRPSRLHLLGLVGGEHDLAGRRARRGRQAGADDVALGLGIDGRVQQLVERGRIDARDRLLARDQPFARHVDGDLQIAALAVRLPERVCSIHSLPRSMVNSRSCMSR